MQTGDVKHAACYLTNYSQTYNDRGLAQSKLWPAGTLCITIAANIADTAMLGIAACFPDSILGFTSKKDVSDVRYVKYCLDAFRDHMTLISRGTTQDNLSLDKLLKLRFWFPDVSDQRKIAAILVCYDDLIANNQRRIALLESMAEEIYRERFVRGPDRVGLNPFDAKRLPSGWQIRRLPEVVDITYGFAFAGERFNSEGIGMPIIRIRNVLEGRTRDYTDEAAIQKYIVRAGDLLIGMDGEFHMRHWRGDDSYLVQRVCRLKAKEELNRAFIAHTLQTPISHLQQTIVGATVGHLGAKHLNAINVAIPDEESIPIRNLLNQLLDQCLQLEAQINALAKMRDALLPRLISGKLRVDHLDIQFPPSMQEVAA